MTRRSRRIGTPNQEGVKKVSAKREKGDAIVIKTEQYRYSDDLKVMRSDEKLVDLGADVRSIRRARMDKMILQLKERKGAANKILAEDVLGEGIEVRALTAKVTLKVKNLDKITDAATKGPDRGTGSLGTATCGGH